MISHAQNMTCHLLSQLSFIGREECESVKLILELILTYDAETGSADISQRYLYLAQRFLPQLTELAARYDVVYCSEKPLHMVNIKNMLATIVKSLVADWSSWERSELHSTMHAARQFLLSDLSNIKQVVYNWAAAHPNGASRGPRRHVGAWEHSSLAKPVTRPTARIVVPPCHTQATPNLSAASILLAHRRTASTTSRPSSSAPQEVKLAELAHALELDVDLDCPRFSFISGDSTSTRSGSICAPTPDDDWRAHLDYFGLATAKDSESRRD